VLTESQKGPTDISNDTPAAAALVVPGPGRQTRLFIVASPRPLTGKTFLARLLADYWRMDGGAVRAFDLNPDKNALADHLPELTTKVDLGRTESQMTLFDRLIVDDGVAKVVDLGRGSYERFFALAEEIGFFEETRRCFLEAIVLFAADRYSASTQAFADLTQRFPGTILVPVFNEAIATEQKLSDRYPSMHAAAVPLQIPILLPALKVHADTSDASFADFHAPPADAIRIGLTYELHAWTTRAFREFRELELRLLLEKLQSLLLR
jgi:hypothetical protein